MLQTNATRKQEKRDSVMMRAQLVVPGARRPSEHRVRNLSRSGCCVDHGGELRRGTEVSLSIGGEEDVPATIAWTTPTRAGVRFDLAVDPLAVRRRRPSDLAAQRGWMGQMSDAYR